MENDDINNNEESTSKELNSEKSEEEEKLFINEEKINEYCANRQIVDFIRSNFSRLTQSNGQKLTRLILEQRLDISVEDIVGKKNKSFYRYNLALFNKDKKLKTSSIQQLKLLLNGFLIQLGKDLIQYDEKEHKDFKPTIIKGQECFIIDKTTEYEKIRKHVCDEGGNVCYRYNFKNPDMEVTTPINKDTIQRCFIQLTSNGVGFDYPIEFKYVCTQCNNVLRKKVYETVCTNNRIKCDGLRNYVNNNGELKTKECGLLLSPDNEVSVTKDAYYYDINYNDENDNTNTAGAISFENYKPGFYEAVLFKIKNPKKTKLLQILDIKEMKNNVFILPEKISGENYVLTLYKHIDKFITQQTNMVLFGLTPIKIAMILQAAVKYLGLRLVANVQIVGNASTGKSTILKYYGFFLHSHYNMSTNGLSISIPGLRGTQHSVNLMGKENKIITHGYLGTFNTIHIDEAGENKELVQNLKTFLAEENYSYDKAGADGSFKTRTTHINLSENLDYKHLGQYIGQIRKGYRELNVKIGNEEKIEWDENWDLHLPLYKYDNPYLRKVIKEIREQFIHSQKFWIDGYDYALHERFPYYFYLTSKKHNEELIEVVKGNVSRGTIRENMELIKVLKTNSILEFFNSVKKYKDSAEDVKSFSMVEDILDNYGMNCDSRTREFYYTLVKVSRIINGRMDVNNEDYDLLKYIIENTNCKIDITDTKEYKINGPPDIEKERKKELEIEENTKELNDDFGMPEDEF